MLPQVSLRLDVLLQADVLGLGPIRLDVSSFLPVLEHHLHVAPADALALTHQVCLLACEDLGQQVEQILRSAFLDHRHGFLLSLDGPAEELHLAPHVVAERPADKVLHRLVPLLAVSHVQDARLEERYYVGTEAQVLVHPTFGQAGKVGTLLYQFTGQRACLLAFYRSACPVQAVDVRTQLLVEVGIVRAVYGHLRADGPFGDGAEVDTADGAVGQYTAEVGLPLLNGGRGIPVEADAHPLAHTPRTDACLSVHIARVERQAHDLEMRLAPCRGFQGIELVYLVHLRVQETLLRIGQSLYECGISHVRIYLLNYQSFGTLSLVLVRPLCLHLLLPSLLALQVVAVACADVGQDAVDGVGDAVLPCPRARHQHVHQRSLVLHVVDVAEGGPPQVRGQCREHRMRHRRLINVRRLAHQ